MGSCENDTLHIFFFPFMAHGHMIPIVNMAKLFTEKGAKATIITTPLNAPFISNAIGKSKTIIHIETIEFPSAETGLPDTCENVNSIPSPELFQSFCKATKLFQEPLEQLFLKQRPNCIVADFFFPWVTDSAAKFGIPRLVFQGTCFFSLCANLCMKLHEPYNDVSSDSEPFLIPDLPGEIEMMRMQLPPFMMSKEKTSLTELLAEANESELRSYGVVVNSFYELEKVYADYYTEVLGRKAWHIGPLSLSDKDRGDEDESMGDHEGLKWLDTKKPNSVVYLCFGTVAKFADSQLREIAKGLEASGQQFIWVVRKGREENEVEWLPEGFEERIEGKGLIIRGWAPQVLILEHQAIGAFVTHCGWNSTLEAVTAGVPMVTWPIAAEQFFNEKLVTEVLEIGVPVGAKTWLRLEGDSITWNAVEKAVKRIVLGDEAIEIRNRVKGLSQLAKRAVQGGGSSDCDLNALIEELSSLRH